VKEILTSSATDLNAPATEQGAGLLNVGAAVATAARYNVATKVKGGGVVATTTALNLTGAPGPSSPCRYRSRTLALQRPR
jgi:hypothetical protein